MWLLKTAIAIFLGFCAFLLMQLMFVPNPCCDRGIQYGFPLHYAQDGTFASHGHMLWGGLFFDLLISFAFSGGVVWLWNRRKLSK